MVSLPAGASPFQLGPLDAFLGALCIAAIASLVIFILIAVWVYRDAQTRGMDGNIWAIAFVLAGFFLPFVGGLVVLIVYLIVRAERPVMYPVGVPAAPYAGPPTYPPPAPPPGAPRVQAAPPASLRCRSCGTPLNPGAAFCPYCGTRV
ncbi:MAG TPA: zinc ribbon domain-containing protein [Thermoplasmata archaeon]|nr:zinc ribbon domain-containing protein [Thermoplasmata archaeon]